MMDVGRDSGKWRVKGSKRVWRWERKREVRGKETPKANERRWGENVAGRERESGKGTGLRKKEREECESRNKRRFSFFFVFFNRYVSQEDFAEHARSFLVTPSTKLMQLNKVTPGSYPVQPQYRASCWATPWGQLGTFCTLHKGITKAKKKFLIFQAWDVI